MSHVPFAEYGDNEKYISTTKKYIFIDEIQQSNGT